MADFDEDSSYLQPGFDPNALTMPKLRNILFQHDIQYPSGAKKAQLVDVFEAQLRPKAKRILAQRARVKRTSMGIQDMSSQGSLDEEEEQEEVPAPTPARRSTRKSSATPSAASARSRTSRKSTRTSAADVGQTEEDEEDAASRRSRYSTTTPVPETASESGASRSSRRKTRLSDFDPPMPTMVKEEPSEEDDGASTPTGPSPFTMDNPFQSGIPPVEEPLTASRVPAKKPARRRPTSSGSNTFVKTEEETAPVARSRKPKSTTSRQANGSARAAKSRTVSLEPGEEFTQEEQNELEEEEEATGQQLMPVRRRQTRSGARTGPLVILTTLLVGVAAWWRQEKITAGYCGVGSSGQVVSLSNSNVQLPEFLSVLQPQCEPCPQHAYCYADFEARCEPDFILQNHPLSFGGLVPLAPTCEPDSEKARKVKAVADRALEELREQRAKYECGGTDEQGQTVTTSGLSEETLKTKVSARRRRGMTESEFEDLWKGALGDVLEREEIVKDTGGKHRRRASDPDEAPLLSTTSVARLPLGCTIRRSARLALERNRITLALVILLAAVLAYLRRRLLASRTDRARVPALVAFALDRLATQAALAEQGRAAEPHISMGGLRDDVLRDEFDARRRDRIWSRVRAVVEMNANVRAGVREDRAGDVSRVWEWVGPLPQHLEDSGYATGSGSGSGYNSRRQSGRFSLGRDGGAVYGSSPTPASGSNIKLEGADAAGRNVSPDGEDRRLSVGAESRRWDEGRAAY